MFSSKKLVDYFVMVEPKDIDFMQLKQLKEFVQTPKDKKVNVTIHYNRVPVLKLPESSYNEYFFDSSNVISFFPLDPIQFERQPNFFFTIWYINMEAKSYYGHILRVYEPEIATKGSETVEYYAPKYLCFFSQNYFCISFKNILEEIYRNSSINDKKCYKIENILNYVLYRIYLPKSISTQISFALGTRNFNFTNNDFKCEISIKLLFTVFTIRDLVLIFLSMMMESKILFLHDSRYDLVCPIIYCFMNLLFPLIFTYNVVNNFNSSMLDLIDSPSQTIYGVDKKSFESIDLLKFRIEKLNEEEEGSRFVIVDLEKHDNCVNINYHKEMGSKNLPKKRIDELVKVLSQKIPDEIRELRQELYSEPGYIWDNFSSKSLNYGDCFENAKSNYKMVSLLKNNTKLVSTPSTNNVQAAQNQFGIGSKLFKAGQSSQQFKESEIRSEFLSFIFYLFQDYSDTKHYKEDPETNDLDFVFEDFLADCKDDEVRNYLTLFSDSPCFDFFYQNLSHIVDLRHKNTLVEKGVISSEDVMINRNIKKASLKPGFENLDYQIFLKCIYSLKYNKPLDKIVDYYTTEIIVNTLSIGNLNYELLPYKQVSIFKDFLHSTSIKHSTAVSWDSIIFDKKIIDAGNEDNDHDKRKAKSKGKIQTGNLSKPAKRDKSDMNMSKHNETLESKTLRNRQNKLFDSFKSILKSDGKDIILKFFSKKLTTTSIDFFSSTTKKFMGRTLIKSSPNHSNSEMSDNTKKQRKTMIPKPKDEVVEMKIATRTKQQYIEIYDKHFFTQSLKSKPIIEYHIAYSFNVLQTVSFCENSSCKRPSTIWDIRRDCILDKDCKYTCKYCSKPSSASFIVLEQRSGDEFVSREWSILCEDSLKFSRDFSTNALDNKPKMKKFKYIPIEYLVYDTKDDNSSHINYDNKRQFEMMINILNLFYEYKIRCTLEDQFKPSEVRCQSLISYYNAILSGEDTTRRRVINEHRKSKILASEIDVFSTDSLKGQQNNAIKQLNNILKETDIKYKTKSKSMKKLRQTTSQRTPVVAYTEVKPKMVVKLNLDSLVEPFKYSRLLKDLKRIPTNHKEVLKMKLGEFIDTPDKDKRQSSSHKKETSRYLHTAIDEKYNNFEIIAINSENSELPNTMLRSQSNKSFDLYSKLDSDCSRVKNWKISLQDYLMNVESKGRQYKKSLNMLKQNKSKEKVSQGESTVIYRTKASKRLVTGESLKRTSSILNTKGTEALSKNFKIENSFEQRVFDQLDGRKSKQINTNPSAFFTTYRSSSTNPFNPKKEMREITPFLSELGKIMYNKYNSRKITDYRVVKAYEKISKRQQTLLDENKIEDFDMENDNEVFNF